MNGASRPKAASRNGSVETIARNHTRRAGSTLWLELVGCDVPRDQFGRRRGLISWTFDFRHSALANGETLPLVVRTAALGQVLEVHCDGAAGWICGWPVADPMFRARVEREIRQHLVMGRQRDSLRRAA
jgi:hypothetical protein